MKLDSHPELRPGEVFLGNSTTEDFDAIGWQTKRRGEVAYDQNRQVVTPSLIVELFPVFAQLPELERGGIIFEE